MTDSPVDGHTPHTPRLFSDPVMALLMAIAAMLIATAFLVVWAPLDGSRNYYEHHFFGPAAMMACGHGLVAPLSDISPELDAFLAGKADSFDPQTLPADFRTQGLDAYGRMHRNLLWLVGLVWTLCGISWKALTLVSVLLYTMTALGAYGLFRLGIGRALSAAATLLLLLSPAVLCWLPNLRDYSKAPFFLVAMALMGLLVKYPVTRRRLYGYALALGAVAGAGMGFRTDVLICVLPSLAVLLVFTRVEGTRAVPARFAAAALFLAAFALLAWPVLDKMRNDQGGEATHNIMGGFGSGCFTILGVEPASYEIMQMLDDREIHCTVTAYGIHTFGKQEKYGFMGEFSALAGKNLIRKLFITFPYDMIVRAFGGVIWALGGAQADMPSFPDPFLRSLADLIRPIIALLDASKMWLVAATLLLLAAVRQRYAWLALLALCYFGGYTTLQFDTRHAFHLCVLGYWCMAFVLDVLVLQPLLSKERRARIRDGLRAMSSTLPPLSRRMLAFAIPAALLTIVPSLMALSIERHNARAYRDALNALSLTPLPTHTESTKDGVLIAPDGLLPGHLPVDAPIEPNGGMYSVQTAYIALRFHGCAAPFTLTTRYETADGTTGLSRGVPVRYVDTRPNASTTLFLPIFQMADSIPTPDLKPGEAPPARWCKFLGFLLPADLLDTFDGMYCAEDTSSLPLFLTVSVPEAHEDFLPNRLFAPRRATYNRQFCRAVEGGDLEDAAEYSRRLASMTTYDHALWLNNVTETLFRLGNKWENVLPENMANFDAIEGVYREALKFSPQDGEIRNVLANLLVKKAHCINNNPHTPDEYQKGIENLREAIELMADGYPAYEALSEYYLAQNDLKALNKEWEDAVQRHPDRMLAHFNLGLARERLGELDPALDAYRKALALKPDAEGTQEALERTLKKKAEQCREAGDNAASAKLLEEAVALRPQDDQAMFALAQTLGDLGDVARATAQLHELIDQQSGAYAPYELLSSLYVRTNDLAGLEAEWRAQTAAHPDRMLAQFCLGLALERQNNVEAALAAYRDALRLDPAKTGTKEALARTLLKHAKTLQAQDSEKALAELQEAYQLAPENPHIVSELGLALAAHHHDDEAAGFFRQAIELLPNDYAPCEALSNLYVQKADLPGLLEEWEKAAQEHPDRMLAHFNLGLAHERLGHYEDALKAYRAAQALDPNAQGTLQAIERAEKRLAAKQ